MSEILWLDDQYWEVAHFSDALRKTGHTVVMVDSEDDALRRLQHGPLPAVFIQDLGRPVEYIMFADGKLNTFDDFLEDAGWRFYERFLKTRFPQLPVIICSNLAADPSTKKRAATFNLRLLQKNDPNPNSLVVAVEETVSSTKTLVEKQGPLPLVVALDFDRVNTALLRHLKQNPLDIHQLSWSTFEEFTARLLRELGYEVNRTPLTRDGGVDIWALQRSDLGDILFAVDAKKYSPNRLVGPEPVRAIYAVTNFNNASVGMIITASSFTAGARALESQYRHRISLKEFQDLVNWLKAIDS